jgi:hypothetical protein
VWEFKVLEDGGKPLWRGTCDLAMFLPAPGVFEIWVCRRLPEIAQRFAALSFESESMALQILSDLTSFRLRRRLKVDRILGNCADSLHVSVLEAFH